MAGLHTRKTVIIGYTVGFVTILACLIIKQKATSLTPSDNLATEVDVPATSDKPETFAAAVEQRLQKRKRETKDRARFPVDVSNPINDVYHIYTAQGLEDFVTSHADKPVVVKFANNKACSPCKAVAATYLLSAKWLKDAYFAEIDEGEFDDLDYFAELAPTIPAFKIYVDGEFTPVKEFQGLRNRTHLRDELKEVEEGQRRKRARRS